MSLNSVCIHREALVFKNYLNQVIILCWKLQLLVNLRYIFYLVKPIEQILGKTFLDTQGARNVDTRDMLKANCSSPASLLWWWSDWLDGWRESNRCPFLVLFHLRSKAGELGTGSVDTKGNDQQNGKQLLLAFLLTQHQGPCYLTAWTTGWNAKRDLRN